MRFVDIAIDLAAVFNVSRSIASKHVALRGRQLDVYSKTLNVAALSRTRAATERLVAARAQKDPSAANAERSKDSIEHTEGAGRQPAVSPEYVARVPETPGAELDWQNSNLSFAGDRTLRRTVQSPAIATKTPSDESDVPFGINVNIFHTAKDTKILDSLRKQKNAEKKSETRVKGQAKEHPLRYWPRPSPIQPGTSTSCEPQNNEAGTQVSKPEPSEPSISAMSKHAGSTKFQLQAPTKVQPNKHKVEKGMVELMKGSANLEVPTASAPTYQLRESSVPATRFGRIMNYGGLAAGMLGGAVTESVSRAFGGGGQGSVLLSGKNMERLVAKLSRMRGAALKLGQMMSFQDSKMLPVPLQELLQRVQDRADYMPAWQRDRVLISNLGTEWRELFSEFDEKPIAAASIGQVHKAVLRSNGKCVAVKIQFPGVADSINSDLDNLGILLKATKLLPRGLYLDKTIDNARLELSWECDYEREAECVKRYKELLHGEENIFVTPDVYPKASGKQVLTMDFLDGTGVTRVKSFTQEQRDWIGTQLLRLCLREITEFKFMQTDPNWTNFLYNAESNKLELLDFGASREYPEAFVSQYVRLLEAASRSDRDGVKMFSEDLGYLTGHESKTMLDAHTQSVLTIAEPFLTSAPEVYDFKEQTITERVKSFIPVMLNERLAPPPEETYSLHRKLSGAFLLCARLESKVRCRELFADSMAKSGYIESA